MAGQILAPLTESLSEIHHELIMLREFSTALDLLYEEMYVERDGFLGAQELAVWASTKHVGTVLRQTAADLEGISKNVGDGGVPRR
jgi:hypothetical protein